MIGVDTNILVYAHRQDSPLHVPARACLSALARSVAPWAIPWPCLHEFLAVVTNARIFRPATPLDRALDQIEAWTEAPSFHVIGESQAHWKTLKAILVDGRASGPQVHDARIAAICIQHGVRELWSNDRDFSRFPRLRTVNPLVANA